MTEEQAIKNILDKIFPPKYIASTLKHFSAAVTKYQQEDWEASLLKSGKFVESVLKALHVCVGKTLPPSRQFKVNTTIQQLGQLGNTYDDTIRLTIPRCCAFIFDLVSNRGARHDSDDFDPNKMDASVSITMISWVLSEMIRFASQASPSDDDVASFTESLMEKRHPLFETIDGRTYVNHKGLSQKDLALLLLYANYPRRVSRKELTDSMERHGNATKNAVTVALTNIKDLVDDDGHGNWKLREIGRQKATRILGTLHS